MPDNYISIPSANGSVNISEEVISVICAEALAEVDAVAGHANSVGGELQEIFGKKPVPKGIKVSFENGVITVDTIIVVRYGNAVAQIAESVQDAVIRAVEDMTSMKPVVNVHVSGVAFDK